jgi:hypothetical protein
MAWNDWLYSNTGMDDFMRAGRQVQNQGFDAFGTGDFWQSLGAGLGEAGMTALTVIPPLAAAGRGVQAAALASKGFGGAGKIIPSIKAGATGFGKNLYKDYWGKVSSNKFPIINKLNKGGLLTGAKRAITASIPAGIVSSSMANANKPSASMPTSSVPFETQYWKDYNQNLMNLQNQAIAQQEENAFQSLLGSMGGTGGGTGGVSGSQRQASIDALNRELQLALQGIGMRQAGLSQDVGTSLAQMGLDTSPASYDVGMDEVAKEAALKAIAARGEYAKGVGEAEAAYRKQVADTAATNAANYNKQQLEQLKLLLALGGYNG